MEHSRVGSPEPGGDEERVTPLELFFDLVFVFAVTQVTQLIADDPTWGGLSHALILLALVWWAWAAYAWLTNKMPPAEADRDVWSCATTTCAAGFDSLGGGRRLVPASRAAARGRRCKSCLPD
jgi:Bacterial low temperature requirement A protein (LtrA)